MAWTISPAALDRTLVGCFSSPLGERVKGNELFADAMRDMGKAGQTDACWLYATSGPLADWFRRVASRFEIPAVELQCPVYRAKKRERSVARWKRLVEQAIEDGRPVAVVSPTFDDLQQDKTTPLADQVLAGLCATNWALWRRPEGKIDQLFSLLESDGRPTRVFFDALADGGRKNFELVCFDRPADDAFERKKLALLCNAISILCQPTLIHCTRAPLTTWPGESRSMYVDSTLAAEPRRTSMEALCRIIRQQRLQATYTPRGASTGVVCFSDMPFLEISKRKVFRKHRRRWDWEPYGLIISRAKLASLGARPVKYQKSKTLFDGLAAMSVFTQPATTRDGKVDWRIEQEWRLPGPLDLQQLADEEAIVFTRSDAEARSLRTISRFPVLSTTQISLMLGEWPGKGFL